MTRLRRSTGDATGGRSGHAGRQCEGLSAAADARETARTLSLLGQAVPEFARQTAAAEEVSDAAEPAR